MLADHCMGKKSLCVFLKRATFTNGLSDPQVVLLDLHHGQVRPRSLAIGPGGLELDIVGMQQVVLAMIEGVVLDDALSWWTGWLI